MVNMLESKAVEVVKDAEPAPKVAELMSLQEEIFPWPTEVVELPIETLVVFQQIPLWR